MPERLYSFLVVLLLMFSGEIFGQFGEPKNSPVSSVSIKYIKKTYIKAGIYLPEPGISINNIKKEKYLGLEPLSMVFSAPFYIRTISPSLYFKELGFVCKKEWQLEKLTSVPFRFRLGSLDYVNYLEQKPNALKPIQY